MVKVKIERYSNQLEGIVYIGGKIIFVPKTKIGDIVEVEIVEEKSNYYRGRVSSDNSKIDCPYFYECGGCHLRNFSYEETIEIMDEIGRKRGCLVKGGEIDYTKVANIVLDDFRTGKMGRVTLE